MAIIEANHRLMRDVASAITTYISVQNKNMQSADTEVQLMLVSDWFGMDADEFRKQWAQVNSNDSTTVKFRESLKNYGEGLTACANEYENSQAKAYNRANWLPKILYW